MFVGKKKYEKGREHVKESWENKNKDLEKGALKHIKEKTGNPLACMSTLAIDYELNASKNLLFDKDIKAYRLNSYIYSKLNNILGKESRSFLVSGNITKILHLLASNNQDLKNFLIKNVNIIAPQKNLTNHYGNIFLSRTVVLALKGDWEEVIRLSDMYFEKPLKEARYKYYIHSFEFLKALALKDIDKMKETINIMLEPKIARAMMREMSNYFDFYLQMYVIIYAKIALYHGIDLEIDCDEAPKELIENTPLEEYSEPYEFMKEFDLKTVTVQEWKEWIYKYHPDPKRLERYEKEGYSI